MLVAPDTATAPASPAVDPHGNAAAERDHVRPGDHPVEELRLRAQFLGGSFWPGSAIWPFLAMIMKQRAQARRAR
jgi:hypothetical protein